MTPVALKNYSYFLSFFRAVWSVDRVLALLALAAARTLRNQRVIAI
jgi:hypothetical protein